MLTMEQILAIAEARATRQPQSSASSSRPRRALAAAHRVDHGPRYVELVFEAPEDFAQGHLRPAQYITMGWHEAIEPRYLVLANSPGESLWRCLIGKDSTLGEAICAFQGSAEALGESLRVSPAEGSGFAMRRAIDEDAPLVMLATGSGVATMHSVLRWLELTHPAMLSATSLFYGELHEQALAYVHDLERLADQGVVVTMAYEAPRDPAHPWKFVQQPLLQLGHDELFSHGIFLLSGARPMLRFATHALLERGVDEGRILLNV